MRGARAAQRVRAALTGLLLLTACEGTGSSGGSLTVKQGVIPDCTPIPGTFPSGVALVPGDSDRAAVVVLQPPGVAILELGGERPIVATRSQFPPDSDLDGEDDGEAARRVLGTRGPIPPTMGEVQSADARTLLVSTSGYEQVLVADAESGELVIVTVETPAGFDPGERPLLPPPGTSAPRTGISTFACVVPPEPFDSAGEAIPPDPGCDPLQPSFLTRFTAGKAVAGGHLLVALSNLRNSGRATFFPGALLVFEWDDSGATPRVRPSPVTLFTTGFNPTGVLRHVTPGGRELVLVTVTGAIGAGTGSGNVRTESFLDVVDPTALRVAASVPLGFAGPSFDTPAVDPTGRVALLGSASQRHVFAVDLAPLDDARLYQPGQPPVLLDGLTPGFPDARIAVADDPIVLPDRSDGPPAFLCEGLTSVRINDAGDEAFAIDECDGTLTRLRVDTSGNPPVPLPRARFQILGSSEPFAPTDAQGLPRSPGNLRVREGTPGVDYQGADALVTLGEPGAQVCSLAVEVDDAAVPAAAPPSP